MSAIANSWTLPAYKAKSSNGFLVISIVAHAVLISSLYQLGFFTDDDIDSIPAKTISISLVEPTPPTPKIVPPPKKIEKRVVSTQAPAVKKVAKKPIKKIVKPPEPVVKRQIEASPLPTPVPKKAVFSTPQPSYQPKPKYPLSARRRGKEGVVVFEVSVSNSGQVKNAIIVSSSGTSTLDKAALKAIMTWRFPANKFNSISAFKQKVEFRLK